MQNHFSRLILSLSAMSDVFFIPFDPAAGTDGLSRAAVRLLQTLLEHSGSELPADVPLKVHFGEKGNRTYLKPEVYDGIIDFIQSQGRACHFVETSVLYALESNVMGSSFSGKTESHNE